MEGQYTTLSINILFALFLLKFCVLEAQGQKQPLASALYVFGDSTIDPGNNNVLATIVKANFPPYGRDFPNGLPTGRFSNGRIITDQLSELAGLPDLLPAYLDPEFGGEKLLTGASFGSSASGYADTTSIALNVLTLEKQVENFRLYKARLIEQFGIETANRTVSQAVFAISGGTDDFANNYFLNPLTRKKYTVEQFQDLLLQSLDKFIQNVYSEGATKIAIIGLPPFGCLPSQITLHNIVGNTCVEKFNEIASSFNSKIKALIEKIKPNYPGVLFGYLDVYDKLFEIIKSPTKYGFEETRKGCCGTGLVETAIFCNPSTLSCPDPSKYVFWDSFHPTSECYQIIANDVFKQALAYVTPPTKRN